MAMVVRYGSYAFTSHSTKVSSEFDAVLNDAGVPYAIKGMLRVTGWINADGQTAITSRMNEIRALINRPYATLALYQDSGALSGDYLDHGTSISGVVITRVEFPESDGPNYATTRAFVLEGSAEYPVTGTAGILLGFRETMEFSGGDPWYVCLPALNGPPQRQLVYPSTPYVVIQSGEAIGYRDYPIAYVPGPRWPAYFKGEKQVVFVGPDKYGRQYQRYGVVWRYVHESPIALSGLPTIWPLGA